jgi:hypothetical protein
LRAGRRLRRAGRRHLLAGGRVIIVVVIWRRLILCERQSRK